MEESNYLSIKSWAEEDRPREKLLRIGKGNLTEAELLAILIRTGVKGVSALDLARKILRKVNDNLSELAKLSVADIKKLEKGIGDTKAITIVAALELGRKCQTGDLRAKPFIQSSRDSYEYIYPMVADLPHEVFYAIYLNKANRVMAEKMIGVGGVSATVADIKIILKYGMELLCSSIIAVHNHPSGNLKPSRADMELTRKLKESATLMDIALLDHLIIGERAYYSFADEGTL